MFLGEIDTGADLCHSTCVLSSHGHSTGSPSSHFINIHKSRIIMIIDSL
jgi:hypothetical protein